MLALLIAVIFFIVYGSLYPWQFRPPAAPPLDILFLGAGIPPDLYALRDVVVNLAIYLPVGAVGAGVFRRSRLRFFAPVLLGGVLSFCIEIAQAYTPTRRPSLIDIACNIAGSALGVVAAGILSFGVTSRHAAHPGFARPQRGALAVIALWLAALSFPLFPMLSRTGLYAKLRIFYHAPLSFMTVISFAAIWFAIGRIGLKAWPRARRWWPLVAIILVPAQFFIVERQPLPAEMAGAAIGATAFFFLGAPGSAGQWIAWIFPAVILARGLAPFHLMALPQDFSWIPLRASLETEWQHGIATLVDKAFWYFTAVWLVQDSGVRLRTAAAWVAQLLAAIEIIQIWLPGRSPEITDPLLALAAGAVLWLLRERPVYQAV